MIPLKLSLNNFLCYRENVPTLDFAGLHVACLSGANGHGKSALLDGITWALWGKARGKTQDEIISYGADECRVEFDFCSRDQSYRIIRSHARSGTRRRRGPSDVQLMLLDGDAPRPITGNTIRETQARIEQTVGMDYDTFINSAFLLQGRSDEFTTRTPAERKAVLSKILGLETYDRLQGRAKERSDWAKSAAIGVEASTAKMRQDLEQLTAPATELAAVQERLASLESELSAQEASTAATRERVGSLRLRHAQQQESRERLGALAGELDQLVQAGKAAQDQVDGFEALVDQAVVIRQHASQLAEARRRFQQLELRRADFDAMAQEKAALQRALDVRRTRMESEAKQVQSEIDDRLAPKAGLVEQLETELASLRDSQPALAGQAREVALGRTRITELANRMGLLQGSLTRFTQEGHEIQAKLDLLNGSNGADAVCPLCQTPLSEDGCQRMAGSYDQEIAAKRDDYRQASASLNQVKSEHEGMGERLASQEQALAEAQTKREVKLNGLETRLEESRLARRQLDEAMPRLANLRDSLANGGFAAAEAVQLLKLEERIQELGYDDETRQRSYREAQELEPFGERERLLANAEGALPTATESLAQNSAMVLRRREEMEILRQSLTDDDTALAGLPKLEAALSDAEGKEKFLGGEIQAATGRQGYLQSQVERMEGLTREIKSESARLSGLQDEQSIYQELTTAFGRQGVQAMLIETVVPMLEEETNALLGRMTDNRMSVKLETQRERASGQGEPRETLEIFVSDELGARSYEMYSGGEAFRVNLALRIGLSRVLAQRMGAPLPTLFIDEGFGTQDAAGRERILDVISAIGADFEKVIVITHLDELKEAFPVRIEVQKDASGSTFWLS